jgi:hypothetical protein
MGLFDRLFSSGSGASSAPSGPQPKKPVELKFLDADESSSLGDVNFMRRSNTIRRTFPGTADNPGGKERIADVASMDASLKKTSEGLPEAVVEEVPTTLVSGVPKPVKKTFAQPLSQADLEQRKRGSSLGVNVPGSSTGTGNKKEKESGEMASTPAANQQQVSRLASAKPGAIDPFRQMVKEMNS